MQPTLYDVIGVSPDATRAEIEAACLELAAPYRNGYEIGHPKAIERFAEIDRAFEVLTDYEKRCAYDKSISGFAQFETFWYAYRRYIVPLAMIGAIALGSLMQPSSPPVREISPEERAQIQRASDRAMEREFGRPVTIESLDRYEKNKRVLVEKLRPNLNRPLSPEEERGIEKAAEEIASRDLRNGR